MLPAPRLRAQLRPRIGSSALPFESSPEFEVRVALPAPNRRARRRPASAKPLDAICFVPRLGVAAHPARNLPACKSYVDLEPGVWTNMKIVIKGTKALLYVNGAAQPSLVVNDLKLGQSKGAIGALGRSRNGRLLRQSQADAAEGDNAPRRRSNLTLTATPAMTVWRRIGVFVTGGLARPSGFAWVLPVAGEHAGEHRASRIDLGLPDRGVGARADAVRVPGAHGHARPAAAGQRPSQDAGFGQVTKRFMPWTIAGFAIMVVTGALLFYAIPVKDLPQHLLPPEGGLPAAGRPQCRRLSVHQLPQMRDWDLDAAPAVARAAGGRRIAGVVGRNRGVRAHDRL